MEGVFFVGFRPIMLTNSPRCSILKSFTYGTCPFTQAIRKCPHTLQKEKVEREIMNSKTEKKVIALSVVAATVLGLTGCGNKMEKIIQNLDETNYEEVMRLYADWDMKPEEREPFLEAIRAEMTQTIEEYAQDVITFEQATATIDTIRNINLYELQEDQTLAYAELQLLLTSKENFMAAEEAMAAGNFLPAINAYKAVIETDCNYETAMAKLQEALDAYVGDIVSQAQTLADKGEHDSAISLLRQAETEVKGNDTLSAKIVDVQAQKALHIAAGYAEKGKYELALSTLNDFKSSGKKDDRITKAYDEYLKVYCDEVLDTADKYIKNNNYQKALSLLNDYVSKYDSENKTVLQKIEKYKGEYVKITLQNIDQIWASKTYTNYLKVMNLLEGAYSAVPAQEFQDKISAINIEKPTYLCELECVNKNRFDLYATGDIYRDTIGNEYTPGNLHLVSARRADWEDDDLGYGEYYLGYQYKTLSGVIAPEESSSDCNCSITILGDEVSIFSVDVSRLTEPYYFELDVSSVNFIKISAGAVASDSTFTVILNEFMLQK